MLEIVAVGGKGGIRYRDDGGKGSGCGRSSRQEAGAGIERQAGGKTVRPPGSHTEERLPMPSTFPKTPHSERHCSTGGW